MTCESIGVESGRNQLGVCHFDQTQGKIHLTQEYSTNSGRSRMQTAAAAALGRAAAAAANKELEKLTG